MASPCVPATTAQRSGFLISGSQDRPEQLRRAFSSAFQPLSSAPDLPTRFPAADISVPSMVDSIQRRDVPLRQLLLVICVLRLFEIGFEYSFLKIPPAFSFQ